MKLWAGKIPGTTIYGQVVGAATAQMFVGSFYKISGN